MNPDNGDDAEDFFAKFEREAREAAQRRDGVVPAEPPAAEPPAADPPAAEAPQLSNPFDAPAPPPLVTPPPQPAPGWDQPTQAMGRIEIGRASCRERVLYTV